MKNDSVFLGFDKGIPYEYSSFKLYEKKFVMVT